MDPLSNLTIRAHIVVINELWSSWGATSVMVLAHILMTKRMAGREG